MKASSFVIPISSFLLPACSFSPKHQPPAMNLPAAFKEAPAPAGWQIAEPADHLPRGKWWDVFHDRELDALLREVSSSNQSLQAAIARAGQTEAVLGAAKMAFLPTASATGTLTRNQAGTLGGAGNANALNARNPGINNIQSLVITTNWEMDLWGRLRHGAKGAKAGAEAARADVESARLSLTARAARTYFALRAADAQIAAFASQITGLEKSLQLTRNREAQGIASPADVALAETQLANTRAFLHQTRARRATLEHALAVLAGRVPADFSLVPATLAARVPALPAATPSTLLQRRPDIAAAERRVAAANERIGAARAAFFPVLNLGFDTGWRALADGGIAALLIKDTNFWALGADATLAILDSGRRLATKRQADAAWRESAADYRQTVLDAMREAEDALSNLRILSDQASAQDQALRASRESLRVATNKYEAGTLSYLNVVIAQAAVLDAERDTITLQAARLTAAIDLITALGGPAKP
jgi:NodT family efflux transporter outer membrane factor (OMF) lipoprotein